MAINQNHLFDDLDGVKCAIVEKNCKPERVEFLKKVLEFNRFNVVVTRSPAPKAPPVAAGAEAPPPAVAPDTYTVGVTNLAFNVTNAIFGRLLFTPDGHVVTMAYWQQKESVSHDDVPYFEKKNG